MIVTSTPWESGSCAFGLWLQRPEGLRLLAGNCPRVHLSTLCVAVSGGYPVSQYWVSPFAQYSSWTSDHGNHPQSHSGIYCQGTTGGKTGPECASSGSGIFCLPHNLYLGAPVLRSPKRKFLTLCWRYCGQKLLPKPLNLPMSPPML